MNDYKKLENQPLELVLAEVRFSPIIGIEKYIPELQDQLRTVYPTVLTRQDQTINVTDEGVQLSTIPGWAFVSKNKLSAVDISPNRIVLFTAEYHRFHAFSKQLKQVLDIFSEVVKPTLCTRVGFRYCNAIKPAADETLEQFVEPKFLSPDCLSSLGVKVHHRAESMITTPSGRLFIRGHQEASHFITPPDIRRLPIVINHDDEPSLRLLLDLDHFWIDEKEQTDFDVGSVMEKLESLHGPSREAFWKLTTDYARDEKWA